MGKYPTRDELIQDRDDAAYSKASGHNEGSWCDDCRGYTHAPWCPSYRAADEVSDAEYARLSTEQPASAAGSETGNDVVSEARSLLSKVSLPAEVNNLARGLLERLCDEVEAQRAAVDRLIREQLNKHGREPSAPAAQLYPVLDAGERSAYGYYVACLGAECCCALGEGYDRDAMPEHSFSEPEAAITAWNARVSAASTAPVVAPSTLLVDRPLYSELIHIAAELVRGDGFLSICPEDMNVRLTRADILKTAERQEQRLKDWAYRVRRVADRLSPAAASPAAPQEDQPHPGFDCGGTCVICSGRFMSAASSPTTAAPKPRLNVAFEVWWKGQIARDFIQAALTELEKISGPKLIAGEGSLVVEATAVSAARRSLDSALSTLDSAAMVTTAAPTPSQPARDAAKEIANWLNWRKDIPQAAHEQNIVSITGILSKYIPETIGERGEQDGEG